MMNDAPKTDMINGVTKDDHTHHPISRSSLGTGSLTRLPFDVTAKKMALRQVA
jgi:hypothetical protein